MTTVLKQVPQKTYEAEGHHLSKELREASYSYLDHPNI